MAKWGSEEGAEAGGRYLLAPMFSCHSDLIRGPGLEEDQLSFSVFFWCPLQSSNTSHQRSQSLFWFIMRIGGLVGEPALEENKIKPDS